MIRPMFEDVAALDTTNDDAGRQKCLGGNGVAQRRSRTRFKNE